MKKINKILKINDLIIIFTAFFSISTITQQLVPFSLNRFIGLFLMLILILDLIKQMNRNKVLCWLGIAAVFFISLMLCKASKDNLENYIYWITTLLLMHKLTLKNSINDLIKAFDKQRNKIKVILYVYICINILCMLSPGCYEAYAGWGNSGYFKAYASSPHTLASASCLFLGIACVYIVYFGMNWGIALGVLVSMFSVFQSGARIFLVPVVCMVIICALILFRNRSYRYLFYTIGAFGFLLLFINTGMLEKFQAVLNNNGNGDKLASFTNARSVIWSIDLNSFMKAGIFKKLFGHGFDFVYAINELYYGDPIWAHNDFIQILLSAGIIGLIIYLTMIGGVIKSAKCKNMLIKIMLSVYIILPAFWNGLYIYQHYLYSLLYLWILCNIYSLKEISFSNVIKKGLRIKI